GIVAGLVAALVGYEAADLGIAFAAYPQSARTIGGLVALAIGGAIALGSYRRLQGDPAARVGGFLGSALGAAIVLRGARLLMACPSRLTSRTREPKMTRHGRPTRPGDRRDRARPRAAHGRDDRARRRQDAHREARPGAGSAAAGRDRRPAQGAR